MLNFSFSNLMNLRIWNYFYFFDKEKLNMFEDAKGRHICLLVMEIGFYRSSIVFFFSNVQFLKSCNFREKHYPYKCCVRVLKITARLQSFRTLKLTRLKSFRVIKFSNLAMASTSQYLLNTKEIICCLHDQNCYAIWFAYKEASFLKGIRLY